MSEDRNRLLGTPFVARAARWGVVAWAGIGVLVLTGLFFRFVLFPIRIIFPPLVVALIIVYLLNPIVSWLKRRGVPRILGALVTYLVVLGAVGAGLRFLIPVLADQVEGFSRSLPSLLDRAQDWVNDISQRFGGDGAAGSEPFSFDSDQVTEVAGRLLDITLGILSVALIFLVGLVLGFYLLVDVPKIRRGAIALIPGRRRAEVLSLFRKLGRAVGGFFRGQLLVALFVGIASTVALFVVGLPYWALVGMITGLFNLIPLIGPFIGGGIAAFVAFTTETTAGGLIDLEPGWPLAIGSAIALTIVQQIDNHIISPNVVARTVKLHPVTVMLALLAGGTLLGLWGMLLAVPVVASIKILILHTWDTQVSWPPPAPQEADEVSSEPVAKPPPPVPVPAGAGSTSRRATRWMERWRARRRAASPEEPEGPEEPEEAGEPASREREPVEPPRP